MGKLQIKPHKQGYISLHICKEMYMKTHCGSNPEWTVWRTGLFGRYPVHWSDQCGTPSQPGCHTSETELYGLCFQSEKCEFSRPSVAYLGHVVNAKGSQTDQSKITAVVNSLLLQNVRMVVSCWIWHDNAAASWVTLWVTGIGHGVKCHLSVLVGPECRQETAELFISETLRERG